MSLFVDLIQFFSLFSQVSSYALKEKLQHHLDINRLSLHRENLVSQLLPVDEGWLVVNYLDGKLALGEVSSALLRLLENAGLVLG